MINLSFTINSIMKIRGLCLLAIFFSAYAFSSQSDSAFAYFINSTYDIGEIYEADGVISIKFRLKNTGVANLTINRIVATGFEVGKLQKKTLGHGEESEIKLTLNPFGKSGYINKEIKVFSNAINSPSSLSVKGIIVHGSNTNTYKHTIGNLSFKQSQLNFGYIYKGDSVVRFLPIKNKSDKPLKYVIVDESEYIEFSSKIHELQPLENSMIEVKYKTEKCHDWDFIIDKVKVHVISNDTVSGWLTVISNIREDFSNLSNEEKLTKPELSIPIKIYNFDTIKSSKTASYSYPVFNNGERELEIRALKPTCGCTVAMPEKHIIPPGDSTLIKVEFAANGHKGNIKNGVTVISNDPNSYKQFLWITGYVD